MNEKIINIAIIAHVDHGKTTLIDSILSQSGIYRANQTIQERAMDSNDLEKERGITILAKCTSIGWKDYRVNIVDTPGHADFGGEVERILGMVDGVVVLIDAAEGPMPQTKFVLTKALALNLKPVVVINKVDRSDARCEEVLEEIYELFLALNATEDQLDFKVVYASGRNGWATLDLEQKSETLEPLMEVIMSEVPLAASDVKAPFKFLGTILDMDSYLGTLLVGKVESGSVKVNMPVKVLDLNGEFIENGRISKLFKFEGLNRVECEEVLAGNICVIAGLKKASVTNTICDLEVTEPVKSYPIDPPTMSVNIYVNDSPFAGKEGKKCTSRMIGDRLFEEQERNLAIKIIKSENNDSFNLAGRGELQIGVLIETMRREGFEMMISKPNVIMKKDEKGKTLEPVEEVIIDVDEEYSGTVVENISIRKGVMQDMFATGVGKNRIIFLAPTRGLIGYHSAFLTNTRGTGIMNRLFKGYEEHKGSVAGRRNGVLISNGMGDATSFALFNLESRGKMFIEGTRKVYEGMIIGEHNKENDLDVNIIRGKQLTNVRTAGKDDAIKCTPPILMTLEEAMAYISDDELVEITPNNIRLRKKYLTPNERKKSKRN